MGQFLASSSGAGVAIYLVVVLALAVLEIAGLWMVFVKAGEAGWKAIIPFYNIFILLKIVGRPGWWLALYLLVIIPFIGQIAVFIIAIIVLNDLSKSFGKSAGFTVGLVLLGFVFLPILGLRRGAVPGPGSPAVLLNAAAVAAPDRGGHGGHQAA